MLLEALQRANIEVQQMRDEIAVLKGQKAKPKFKSNKMDQNTNPGEDKGASPQDGEKSKRAGSTKRSKTAQLQIHEECVIAPVGPVPGDARFKGYRDIVVQGLVIKAHNTRYRLESWRTREGTYLTGQLPASVQGHHFDPQLRSYVLHQHNHCHVTQPLLLEQLRQWGIDISTGQINALLSADNALFHQEKDAILVTATKARTAMCCTSAASRPGSTKRPCATCTRMA